MYHTSCASNHCTFWRAGKTSIETLVFLFSQAKCWIFAALKWISILYSKNPMEKKRNEESLDSFQETIIGSQSRIHLISISTHDKLRCHLSLNLLKSRRHVCIIVLSMTKFDWCLCARIVASKIPSKQHFQWLLKINKFQIYQLSSVMEKHAMPWKRHTHTHKKTTTTQPTRQPTFGCMCFQCMSI